MFFQVGLTALHILQRLADGGRNRLVSLLARGAPFGRPAVRAAIWAEDGQLAVQLLDLQRRPLHAVQRACTNRADLRFKRSQLLLCRCPGGVELTFNATEICRRLAQKLKFRRLRGRCWVQQRRNQQQDPDLAAHKAAEKTVALMTDRHVSIPEVVAHPWRAFKHSLTRSCPEK
jgi:hypothetical protein